MHGGTTWRALVSQRRKASSLTRQNRRALGELEQIALDHARFDIKFELTIEGARRHDRTFSISKFSFTNHDEAMRAIHVCRRMIRTCDAARLDGPEVVVVWDSTDHAAGCEAARRLVGKFDSADARRVATVSYPQSGYTVEALLAALATAPSDDVVLAGSVTDLAAHRLAIPIAGRRRRRRSERSA